MLRQHILSIVATINSETGEVVDFEPFGLEASGDDDYAAHLALFSAIGATR